MDGHEGEIAYAQIALVAIRNDTVQYGGGEFKANELKPAVVAYCRQFAGSRRLVQDVCRLACQAGDFQTAGKVFYEIPLGDYDGAVWSSALQMEEWRSKVNGPYAGRIA